MQLSLFLNACFLALVALLVTPSQATPVTRSTSAYCDAFTKACSLWANTTSSCSSSSSALTVSCKTSTTDVTGDVVALLASPNTATLTSTMSTTVSSTRTRTKTVQQTSTVKVKVISTTQLTVTAATVTSKTTLPTTTTVISVSTPWVLQNGGAVVAAVSVDNVVSSVVGAASSAVAAATSSVASLGQIGHSGEFIVAISASDIMRRDVNEDEEKEEGEEVELSARSVKKSTATKSIASTFCSTYLAACQDLHLHCKLKQSLLHTRLQVHKRKRQEFLHSGFTSTEPLVQHKTRHYDEYTSLDVDYQYYIGTSDDNADCNFDNCG
ncbi:hypothetical protein BCV69DRAFT_292766 [Microstroma glucosiphilum]|uniref:Uncharacterized protein n=1 Tax=Pseudomicrostroma glucosiphilum TaxID=1684307 RepID=A0A316UBM1_9BASI|nr:hypothetical protein BCV69DRAFT_292766 [Pseudomicrostroma glucosiphilum]PWN22258.1 hypothetical protein BCV69DRAFT_292766 [Pseudomicrostroma glucosiphilum]